MTLGLRRLATKSSSNLRAPAYNWQHVLQNIPAYQQSVDLRGTRLHGGQNLSDMQRLCAELAAAKKRQQELATERNRIVRAVKHEVGRAALRDQLPEGLKQRSVEVKHELAQAEAVVSNLDARARELMDSVPNLLPAHVASIKGEFETVWQSRADVAADASRDHVNIATELGLLDMAAGSRVSGTGNTFLVGQGALLELAIVHYAMARVAEAGFRLVSPPSLVRREFSAACGFRPRDDAATQVYTIANSELCLTGTAEIPLAAQMAHLRLAQLPQRHAGVSRSFRAEAGARGTDTRGLYRLHEFTKVEMFVWSSPEQSARELDALAHEQRGLYGDLLESIGVPVRVIRVGPTDLGNPAYEKYDIEAWMPGRGSWGEISSASNCLDFQSRRLHTTGPDGAYVHTLNATAAAVPRLIVAILENGWDPQTRTVRLPPALHAFMGTNVLAKA